MATIQLVIGHNEFICFPAYGVSSPVPAKIDTGADGCAIWASSVVEDESGLHFKLFDSGSVFFTGQQLDTQEYKTKRIKNSFGNSEVRYSVKLSFTLGKKRYKNWFSLANRSNNHFPILLGRKFLKDRFLVDVARHHLLSRETTQSKVLVLVEFGTSKTKTFFAGIEKTSGADITLSNYDELVFSTLNGLSVTLGMGGTDVAAHKLVYIKSHIAHPEMAGAIATYLDYRNIVYRDSELAQSVSQGKLTEAVILKSHGISSPPMLAMKRNLLRQHFAKIVDSLGLPFVLKDTLSNRGKFNYLVNTEPDFDQIMKESDDSTFYMAQQFIPNDGYTRVVIFENQEPVIIARASSGHKDPRKSHLNNPFGGVNATLINVDDADPNMIDTARRAARVMEREIAGVDMIKDSQTGEWYVLEVNNNPQIMTGSFVPEKAEAFAKYLKIELDRW